jgi:Tfp pilus assembly protein FimT|nr:GspH/FimT family pseudopilin [Candidatus Acidoferrales bacterium]
MNRCKNNKSGAGYTTIEAAMVITIVMILVGMAIPKFVQAISNYKLRAAADSVAWAMQSTRYQALQKGYTYELTVNSANNTYQVLSKPVGASSFSNVGSAVPLTSSPVTISATTTLTFSPNGSVTVVTGSQTITLTYSGMTETVTVTNYGSVTVTP